MVVNMTYNENIKTFNDIVHHVELEAEWLMVVKPTEQACLVESSSHKTSNFKHNINSLRRIRSLMMLQRKERSEHTRSLSMLRRIRASWNATTMAIRVTSLMSALSRNRYGLVQITYVFMFLVVYCLLNLFVCGL